MNKISRVTWEKNGNFPEEECGIHAMDKLPNPLSSCGKCFFRNEDHNSNQILNSESQKEGTSTGSECHHCADTSPNHNKDYSRDKQTPNSPTNTFSSPLHQKDLSYDDLSKNIDANLAEIDMETFRSEDINSILALPAIYSGQFDSVNHGEQCASVSGSLLNGLEIETSSSNRISEDEISICKDEPLFSPQREPSAHERTISVDGLDNSSSYDQDLVLTCKANKNNYTIVFEGSETQYSEDSEFHNGLRSSEVVSSASEEVNNETSYSSSSMIQSDLVFTTWSNLKRAHLGKKRKKFLQENAIKSKSLPNLSYPSAFFNDKLLQWAKLHGTKNYVFPDLDLYQQSGFQVVKKGGYPYTLSLVKLFTKYKVSSRSSIFSSEHSGSTNSLPVYSLNNINYCSQVSCGKIEGKERETEGDSEADLANQNYNVKNQISLENLNSNQKRQLIVDNIRILDWHPTQNVIESNNNPSVLKTFPIAGNKLNHNTNNQKDANPSSPTGECENSQYFEDSLIEAPILQVKNFNATPIKEEEETDISSGDEVMKTSMSSNNCSSSSIEAITIKNNALDAASNAMRQDIENNLERIINIFPSCKANAPGVFPALEENKALKITAEKPSENHTQSTQTKQCNGKAPFDQLHTTITTPKVVSKRVPSDRCKRHSSSGSRENSPNSSGYLSSRHSSVERLQRSLAGISEESFSRLSQTSKLKNVLLTKTRSCSTQVPVHVKDECMQTSSLTSSNPNIGFFFKNSANEEMLDAKYMMEQNSRSAHEAICTSNPPQAKEDKCIYVCFPNYSLPDLSFLKSIASEEANSVFMSPTKYRPPQKVTYHGTRPRSSEGLDSDSKKRLSNIKDWESLSVLLPDDLKDLLSQVRLEDKKSESPTKHGLTESKTFPIPKLVDKVGLTEHPSAEGIKAMNFAKHCSFDFNAPIPWIASSHSSSTQCNRIQHGSSMKSCSCSQESNVSTSSCSKEGSKVHLGKNVACHKYQASGCSDLKSPKSQKLHSCHKHFAQKHFVPVVDEELLKISSGFAFADRLSTMSPNRQMQAHYAEVMSPSQKHPTCATFKNPHKCKSDSPQNSTDSMENSPRLRDNARYKNAVEYESEFNFDKKSPSVELDAIQSAKSHRSHDDMNSDDFFDLEKAPQEFLVSPVQNATPYSVMPESYELPTSITGRNTVFHESLKRKTGLVESLQKAVVLIFESQSDSFKRGASCCTSFSVGQKILTTLCPAVHTILSDGLLPSVQGFFGPLPNSPWKVTEAFVQLENSKKEVQELLKIVNSEKLLTDSTYRFNAFVMGLLNLGCLEWWFGHLLSSRSLISHHYHPTALLSLLSLPASSHLQQELRELVSPLTNASFNLDIALETKIAAASNSNEKWNSNCCSTSRPEEQNKMPNYAFCLSNVGEEVEGNIGPDMKHNFNMEVLSPTKAGAFKLDGQDPVWPGVTINPFPNMRMRKDPKSPATSPQKAIDPRSDCPQKVYCSLKDKKCRKRITDFSLCSSTDSGCSSQVCQSHDISLAATESVELENQATGRQDGQQFKKLQQKWEKITLGIEKQRNPKNLSAPSTSFQTPAGATKKSPEKTSKKSSRSQGKVAPSEDNSRNAKSTKRAVSQPPICKAHFKISEESEEKTREPGSPAKASGERKNRSHIPTLKAPKCMQPKSKIPIQKSGARTQSANRDPRNM